jgi:hypothetical protein
MYRTKRDSPGQQRPLLQPPGGQSGRAQPRARTSHRFPAVRQRQAGRAGSGVQRACFSVRMRLRAVYESRPEVGCRGVGGGGERRPSSASWDPHLAGSAGGAAARCATGGTQEWPPHTCVCAAWCMATPASVWWNSQTPKVHRSSHRNPSVPPLYVLTTTTLLCSLCPSMLPTHLVQHQHRRLGDQLHCDRHPGMSGGGGGGVNIMAGCAPNRR